MSNIKTIYSYVMNRSPCLLNPDSILPPNLLTLQEYIDKNKGQFSGQMLCSITLQIFLAIQQLHSKYCIHANLCIENIFVSKDIGDLFLKITPIDIKRHYNDPNFSQIISEDCRNLSQILIFLREIPLTDDSFDVNIILEELLIECEFPLVKILRKYFVGSDWITKLIIRRIGIPSNSQVESFLEDLKKISNPIVEISQRFLTFGKPIDLKALLGGSLDASLRSLSDFLLNHQREGTDPKRVLHQWKIKMPFLIINLYKL
jgi:hypothetical protein